MKVVAPPTRRVLNSDPKEDRWILDGDIDCLIEDYHLEIYSFMRKEGSPVWF